MNRLKNRIREQHLAPAFFKGTFGIEKEGLRVTETGKLALTGHPNLLGNRSYHPYIQTDFSESQLELVTPPVRTIDEMYNWLMALHDVAQRSLPESELIWPMSMPVELPEEKQISVAQLDNQADVNYRLHLAEKYGKKKQMVCGIHYNFELDSHFLQALFQNQTEIKEYSTFQSEIYMKLAKNFLRYRWLLTYLFGASPIVADNFYQENQEPLKDYVRSVRSSHYGYVNTEDVRVSFASLESYVEDIEALVQEGALSEEKEFYSPVRLRGGKKVRDLLTEGIHYLEFRMFDLNPYAAFGMQKTDMKLIHLFLLSLVWLDKTATVEEIEAGNIMNEKTALEHPHASSNYQKEALGLIDNMLEMIQETDLMKENKELILAAKAQILNPQKTLAGKMIEDIAKVGSYTEFGLQLGKQFKEEALAKPYSLRGFTEMELSTQLLMFDAIQKGVEVDILDASEQFLKLTHEAHIEYVKNANMTSKDQYIAPLIMENKTVTKKVLAGAGFKVPAGEEYQQANEAKAAYWNYSGKGIVIKPKSTNFGVGISIFKDGPSKEDYDLAVDFAFKEDKAILVEEFITGTEYRFFVLGDSVKAIMLRMPANVVGDGIHTIKELVATKNQDPLRGTDHLAPLEIIQLGEIEQLMLKEQGYKIDDIPATEVTVYLRENSNISTGGDSFDYTDTIDDSYKKAAIEMTKAVGAVVCGVDLIIPDYTQPSTKEQPGYAVIEANFNPAMHMHTFPYKGKGRRLTMAVLDLLFPELKIISKK
ncbi:bifunctional glutamate--cysteine ligase GshA/glutathione synthetase GshB [Carnobacterium gallinarum]|uniref:bifunctional glutamate--cysteine ligase GshA/glutathione synthetase GshB n=1 Tax=Carnobacterium gallinarum TaxID=2749 RepID=UPI00054F7A4B|nr:bifunctional glutamate--cysteine ligase GshA/glutathione synthetase GshB [Carnobacterium gallinarum]